MKKNPLETYARNLGSNPWTISSTGRKIYYAHFDYNDIRLEDIAWQLAHTNRWCGALANYYSTAQHSVLLARHALKTDIKWLPRGLDDSDRRLFAKALLFHDSEEYITCDFPSPLKVFFPLYTEYADFVRKAIFNYYQIPYLYYDYCKRWDRRILFDEAEWGLAGGRKAVEEPGDIVASLGVDINPWSAYKSYTQFRNMYLDLA